MLHHKTFYANTFMTTLLVCHQGKVQLKILVPVVQFRPEPPQSLELPVVFCFYNFNLGILQYQIGNQINGNDI